MKKQPIVAVLNSIEAAGAQIISGNGQWNIVKTSAGLERRIGPFATGLIKSVSYIDPQTEHSLIVAIGADATPEVITASTKYQIIISPDSREEGSPKGNQYYTHVSAATLSGTASTDRSNVYSDLVTKINAYAKNDCTAYGMTVADFTLGTSTGDAATNFIVGETVTQETSAETAKVAKCSITSGTMAADNAAGKIWLYDISDVSSWLTTAKTLTAAGTVAGVSTNCVVTVTNATTVHNQGIVIVDDSGYFTSYKGRGGANYVGKNGNWATSTNEVVRPARYAIGIGSDILNKLAVYDRTNRDVVNDGDIFYDLQGGDAFDSAKTYRKYTITVSDGDELALSGEKESTETRCVLYCYYSDADLGDFNTALNALT